MNKHPIIRPIAFALCAFAAGCSNHESATPGLPTSQNASAIRPASTTTVDTVYVADYSNYTYVTARDGSGNLLRQMIDGVMNNPESVGVDSSSNVYVGTKATVVKYPPGGIVPSGYYDLSNYVGITAYTSDIVADDTNLYVALSNTTGWKGANTGAVLVYPIVANPNGSIRPTRIVFAPTGAHPQAVTLDAQKNLYVQVATGLSWPHPGFVLKFKPSDVVGTQLPLRLGDGDSGSLAFDAQGNLVACDDYVSKIEVFPPNAATPSRTISSGMKGCHAFAFSSDKQTLYATDQPHQTFSELPGAVVHKYVYASGTLEATLTAGINAQYSTPLGLAVAPAAPF